MKKIFALLFISFLMMSCQSATEDLAVDETIPSTDYAPDIDELFSFASEVSRDEVTLLASSELEDDTEYGFSYLPESAVDQDLSTAWCTEEFDLTRRISLSFPESVLPGTLGIQTGFARTEEIFLQNNRVKTADLYYDGELMETLEFEDTYDMQFIDLMELPASEISFYITDVYEGSKYNDTCISEIDFWSDYVLEKDADAAMMFYISNKAKDAIVPVSSDGVNVIPNDAVSYCGAFDTSTYSQEGDIYTSIENNEYGYTNTFADNSGPYAINDRWFEAGLSVSLSAKMSSEVTSEDEFTVRWWKSPTNMETDERVWSVYHESVLSPQECNDGSHYLSMEQPPADIPGPFALYNVEVLYNGEILGSSSFNFVQ
jgi:hypothetical protein